MVFLRHARASDAFRGHVGSEETTELPERHGPLTRHCRVGGESESAASGALAVAARSIRMNRQCDDYCGRWSLAQP
jgi:hypothetical protein